jgi:hypothetical protein
MQGRGLTIVDTHTAYAVPTRLGHAISYLPANLVTAAVDARIVREYDPKRKVGVRMISAGHPETMS